MIYSVRIAGNWWTGYWVVTYADGREGGRSGPYRKKRDARETAALMRAAYGLAP